MANYGARLYPWQKNYNFNHKRFMLSKELIEQLRKAIKDLLATISERERKILDMRFGLTDGTTHTLEQVGKTFGITRERIRQIEMKTIENLKKAGWITVDK